MRKFFTLLAALAASSLAVPLAGCADKQVANFICTHQLTLGPIASATIKDNTGDNPRIKNSKDRQFALDGAANMLEQIAKCDPATPQVSAPPPVAAPG